jgi:UDP-3-O-[3-hydroxymyristoyl] glucosamine N-acyltransferase
VKLKELAKLVSGKVVGNEEITIKRVAPVQEAGKGDLIFVLESQFLPAALRSKASAIVAASKTKVEGIAAILVDDPRLALAKILPLFAPKRTAPKGIHKTALIPRSCRIGKEVSIGPFVVLEENVAVGDRSVIYPHVFIGQGTRVGKDCLIHSNASLYERVSIGDRVILHSGVRVGVDGFGFVQEGGKHRKIPQVGTVIIEDDVEIYGNVCVARGTLGATIIGAGTKIDNLTHIAHNTLVGKDCAITALVGFAGSVTLQDRVYIGGQAGFNGHITVGENTVVMAKAGVTKDIPKNSVISGFPAQDHHQEMQFQAELRRLARKPK